jgi:hypothetical protein
MNAKPARQYKGDALTFPGASASQIACDHAVAPFDRAARLADHAWGINKLVELVSPTTAAKYGSAIAKLNAALAADNAEDVAARAAVCMRGLVALETEARAAGHTPATEAYWHAEHEGRPYILARDIRDWPAIEAKHPGVPIYSLREVGLALQAYGQTVVAIKAALPGAQVGETRPATPLERSLDDAIPF